MFYCGYDPGLLAYLHDDQATITPPRWLAVAAGGLLLVTTVLLATVQP